MINENYGPAGPRMSIGRLHALVAATFIATAAAYADPPAIPVSPADPAVEYEVLRIAPDGRPVLLANQKEYPVKLAGIADPADDEARRGVCAFLEDLLLGERVRLELATGPDGALATPLAARLFRMPEGLYVNLEAVRQGRAAAVSALETEVGVDPGASELKLLRYYEEIARQNKKGIWKPAASRAESEAAGIVEDRSASRPAETEADQIVVYVTESGGKYHRAGCQHLKKSSKAIKLSEAVEKGYEPCKRCKPPVLPQTPP